MDMGLNEWMHAEGLMAIVLMRCYNEVIQCYGNLGGCYGIVQCDDGIKDVRIVDDVGINDDVGIGCVE